MLSGTNMWAWDTEPLQCVIASLVISSSRNFVLFRGRNTISKPRPENHSCVCIDLLKCARVEFIPQRYDMHCFCTWFELQPRLRDLLTDAALVLNIAPRKIV